MIYFNPHAPALYRDGTKVGFDYMGWDWDGIGQGEHEDVCVDDQDGWMSVHFFTWRKSL